MSESSAVPWQPVVAALANEQTMAAYARRFLGQASVKEDAKQLGRLSDVGLLDAAGEVAHPGVLQRILESNARPKRIDVEKFFDAGRLTHLPAGNQIRVEILTRLAHQLIPVEDVFTEREINLMLQTVTADVPTLRRALIDFGLLQRTIDGSKYVRGAAQE